MYKGKTTLYSLLSIINNIKDFLHSLTAIDIIFFFAVLLLMILLVALLYFIKTNADYTEVNNNSLTNDSVNNDKVSSNHLANLNINEEQEYNPNQNLESKKYIANSDSNRFDYYNDEENELLDLETITKKLENKELAPIDLSAFEEEQEKDAIISYDELINRSSQLQNSSLNLNETKNDYINSYNIPYKSETMLDDLLVKEVDINSLESTIANEKAKTISYSEEEAFLNALKKLQQSLR